MRYVLAVIDLFRDGYAAIAKRLDRVAVLGLVALAGVDVSTVVNTLQSVLGSFYVNDFNLFGRTWQVNVQGEALDRSRVDDIFRINVRNARGEMVPLRAIVSARVVLGPQSIIRYNNFRSVTVNGQSRPWPQQRGHKGAETGGCAAGYTTDMPQSSRRGEHPGLIG